MARTFTAADGVTPEDLVHSALDHINASEALAKASPSFLDSAGYLAHMAVELVLKAWLLHSSGSFKGIHTTHALYRELNEKHGAPELDKAQSQLLDILDKYEELRYPNRKSPVEVGNEELEQSAGLVDFLCELLPDALQESVAKLDATAKGGRVLMRRKIERQ